VPRRRQGLQWLDLKHRLYSEILRMSAPRAGALGERAISPPPFHHVIANRIGCRREQVTREPSKPPAESNSGKTRGGLGNLGPLQPLEDHQLRDAPALLVQ